MDTDAWVKLRWEKESRYYEAHLHQDLWGEWIVTRVWGRRGGRLGRVLHVPCPSRTDGMKLLRQIDHTRQRHGYRCVRIDGPYSVNSG